MRAVTSDRAMAGSIMARCYSAAMRPRHPLPNIWLISDVRNDAVLESALSNLPRGSGFVFRHYHLDEADRAARFAALRALCRELGHTAVLSGSAGLGDGLETLNSLEIDSFGGLSDSYADDAMGAYHLPYL